MITFLEPNSHQAFMTMKRINDDKILWSLFYAKSLEPHCLFTAIYECVLLKKCYERRKRTLKLVKKKLDSPYHIKILFFSSIKKFQYNLCILVEIKHKINSIFRQYMHRTWVGWPSADFFLKNLSKLKKIHKEGRVNHPPLNMPLGLSSEI